MPSDELIDALKMLPPKWWRNPNNVGEALVYLAECQLATLDHFLARKGQINERKRHIQVSALCVDAARRYSTPKDREVMKTPRLSALIEEMDACQSVQKKS